MKHPKHHNLYDIIGEKYRQNRPKTNADHTEIPTIVSLAGNVCGKRVLDAGCGLGQHSLELIKRGAIVTGVDISEKMVGFSRKACGGRGEFFVADFAKARFLPESFDLIVASFSIHYLKDIEPVFKRFHRFLRPGGRMVFSIYHPNRFQEKIKNFDYSRSKKYWFRLNSYDVEIFNYYHPLEKYIDAIVKNGFKLDKVREPVIPKDVKGFDERKYRIPSAMVFAISKC